MTGLVFVSTHYGGILVTTFVISIEINFEYFIHFIYM